MMACGRLPGWRDAAFFAGGPGPLREDRVPGDGEYGLLGPLLVRRGGAVVRVAPGKQRVVLAVLLLRGGRVAGLDELAEALWGGQPPPSARVSV
jgi:hypothetical protein